MTGSVARGDGDGGGAGRSGGNGDGSGGGSNVDDGGDGGGGGTGGDGDDGGARGEGGGGEGGGTRQRWRKAVARVAATVAAARAAAAAVAAATVVARATEVRAAALRPLHAPKLTCQGAARGAASAVSSVEGWRTHAWWDGFEFGARTPVERQFNACPGTTTPPKRGRGRVVVGSHPHHQHCCTGCHTTLLPRAQNAPIRAMSRQTRARWQQTPTLTA